MADNTIPATQFEEILNFQFEQPSRKKEKPYGLKLVKSLWSGFSGSDGYFSARNRQWAENDDFAKGKVKGAELMKSVGVEGEKSWVNYDLKALLRIVPRYVQGILGGFMNREEKPSVDATDILSKEYKAFEKTLSKYRLENKDQIAAMEQAAGTKLEQGFTPQDEDELELYYQMEYRLPEEMFFERTIDEVFQNSDFENLKRTCIGDLIKKNLAVTKIIKTNDQSRTLANRLSVRRCKPDRVIYNIFESPIGKDISLIGEVFPMSISDIRKFFPKTQEKTLYALAQKSAKAQNLLNFVTWRESFVSDLSRPYDDYKIPVFDFEVKSADKYYFVKDTNYYGKDTVFKKNGKPSPQKGEIIEDVRYNIYCGTWAVDTDEMLYWDMETNQIRPYQNGVDCFLNYSAVYPDNDGTLIPSLLERGTACVREMVRCALKIQQMMILMKPDDVAIDVAGLRDLDIGTGDTLKPMQILKLYDQTGRILWDSTDVTGTNGEGNKIPFTQIPNSGNAAQINTLIGLYNFWLARLNDEWGTNPDAMGQPVPARRSVGVNQQMIQASNQALEYVYESFIELIKQNASKIAMKLWDIVIFEATDYKGMDEISNSLIDAQFDVNIDMIPVQESKQRLQQKIDLALEKGTISLGQAIRLENMDNVKDAEMYLIKLEKKQQQDAAASQQQSIDMNAMVQQKSLEAKGNADIAVENSKKQAEALLSKAQTDNAAYLELVKMVTALQVDAQANGRPISEDNMKLVKFITERTLQQIAPQPQEAPQQEQAEPATRTTNEII